MTPTPEPDDQHASAAAIRAEERIRKEERAACARAICHMCYTGSIPAPYEGRIRYWHPGGLPCVASPIHERSVEEGSR